MSNGTITDTTISRKSVSKTYRIRKDVLDEIDKRANEYGISSNQLVNQWLTKCMYLEPLWKHLNAITIGRSTLLPIIASANKDELEKIGSDLGKVISKNLFCLYNVELSWASVTYAFQEVYGKNCNWFDFKHHVMDDTHNLVFVHDLGLNWSNFLNSYIGIILKTLLKVDAVSEIDEKMVKFTAKDRHY